MPIYEYECGNCGHTLEVIQKFSDAPLTECPACHQQRLQKRVSAAAFHLKGSGWYATDFKEKPKPVKENEKKEDNKKDANAKTGEKDKADTNKTAGETPASPKKNVATTSD